MWNSLTESLCDLHDRAWGSILGSAPLSGDNEFFDTETDQILQFLDDFDEKPSVYQSVLNDQEREDLDSKRTAYINCVTAIDHNNEQIGVLLGDLKTYRQQLLLALQTASGSAVIKDWGIKIAQCKLDISDRKSKRNMKEHERLEQHYRPLADVIAQIQLKFLEHTQKAVPPSATESTNTTSDINGNNEKTIPTRAGSAGLRKRKPRPHYYTDKEISQHLKGD